MAITDFGVNDNSTVKLWSKILTREAFAQTYISRFLTRDRNGLLWERDDTTKNSGDRIRIPLRLLLDADGVTEDEVLEGAEESMRFSTDDLFINELAHATRWHDTIATQRVVYDMREEGMSGLGTWIAERFDEVFFNQLAGNTGQSSLKRTGNNAAIAPTSTTGNTRMIIGPISSPADAEASLSSTASQSFQLPMIDRAVKIAKTATPLIRPIRVDGVDRYVLFISPGQLETLRTDVEATRSRISWENIHRSALQGGEVSNNPIFTGAIGMYNNTIIHESTRLPTVGSVGARRAVFCGAGAAAMAFGKETPGMSRLDWHEESFDHGRQHSVKTGSIYGLKKLQFTNRADVLVDYGTIVLTTMEVA